MDNTAGMKILQDAFVANMHDDFLCDLLYRRTAGERDIMEREILPRFAQSHLNMVVAAIYIEDIFVPNRALEQAVTMIEMLRREQEESGGAFAICTDFAGLEAAYSADKLAIFLSLEGAEPIGDNLYLLDAFYSLGVRFIGPCWARRNAVADGNSVLDDPDEEKAGFTRFGKAFLARCAALGMILDVSHISDRGFSDMLAQENAKVIASHSNARAVYPSARNMPDWQIEQLRAQNTIVGLNTCGALVADRDQRDFAALLRHLDYLVEKLSEDNVCLGLDFCEKLLSFAPAQPHDGGICDIIRGYADIPVFVDAMLAHGYAEESVKKIIGGNAFRFMRSSI